MWWKSEVEWIEAEAKVSEAGMFPKYCVMQAAFAKLDGFPELADRILEAGRSNHETQLDQVRNLATPGTAL
jgi:hypothetical protein